MKNKHYFLAFIVLLGLTSCGGSNTASSNSSSSSAIDSKGTPVAAAEANADTSSQEQAEQPAAENDAGSSNQCDNEFYPVKSGASWDYTLTSSLTGTDSFTRSILSTTADGFTDQDVWAAGTVRTGSWSCDNGTLTALSLGGLATVSSSAQNFVATSQESSGITYPSPLDIGMNWSQHLLISGDMVVTEGMSGTATADATQSCTAIGEENITVSAGTFNAMKLNCNTSISVTVDIEGITIDPMTITSTSEVWLASDVGMVKTVDKNDLTDATIELTAYSIP